MMFLRWMILIIVLVGCVSCATMPKDDGWRQVFSDLGSNDWRDSWFLEGDKAWVKNGDDGMTYSAGPVLKENASHAVLWTKRTFKGDLKIEYDYTRIDENLDTGVNILYIQATGLGTEEWPTDIYESTHKRWEPWMKYYFLYMNSLHISYATDGRYVSSRRYPATDLKSFQKGTQIHPIYKPIDLFEPGKTYHITAIKQGHQLTFIAECDGQIHEFQWDTSAFPPVLEGRIGLRHMWTRCSRYQNVRVYQRN